ncbi:MAG TPA: DUF4846 domain-containing protein [Spirochaetota bacterium]|nr:DUF4846 domain-containing protein [Spirochaetota bacterium]HOD14552.1 DUF4846 domain-containing protein [Spirochaetota bacterium]HPG52405.1 DUF4846 domain-containing protein [Spirochaetota bacterium]HPN11786.1 DUF4846 domain-containing protein [Spirochaetota bacterium]HQL81883.1 DUF4846 domain-containing protein [Spirochaetota bacterium]
MRRLSAFTYIIFALCATCAGTIHPGGMTIAERFQPPGGYARKQYRPESFQAFLRSIPLKEYGAPVLLYDGRKKPADVHVSVLDVPILKKNLVQCADAILLLRAEYLFRNRRYDEITFSITNGMPVPFRKFARGYRLKVRGSSAVWRKGRRESGYTREVLGEYLEFMYAYAGTLSLSRDLKRTPVSDIDIGDVFIQGGSPGHAVIVIDMAINAKTGKKMMLLAQSYMPSQEIHILKSFTADSPWYGVEDGDLETPEWHFKRNSLKRFKSDEGG